MRIGALAYAEMYCGVCTGCVSSLLVAAEVEGLDALLVTTADDDAGHTLPFGTSFSLP